MVKIERLKTYTLIGLFIISIILCHELLTGISFNTNFIFNKKKISTNEVINSGDFLAPSRFIINYSDSHHKMIYSNNKYKVWTLGQSGLKDYLDDDKTNVSLYGEVDEELQNEMYSQKSIVMKFDDLIDIKFASKVLGIKDISIISKYIKDMNVLYFYLGSDHYVIIANDKSYVKLKNGAIKLEELNEIAESIKLDDELPKYYEGYKLFIGDKSKDIFIPVNVSKKITSPYVKEYVSEKDMENIASKYLEKDINYIRKIVQDDDTKIYMYGQKNLVLRNNGIIEYYDNSGESVLDKDLYNSFIAAVNFIVEKTEYTSNIYLTHIEDLDNDKNKGYRFSFSYNIFNRPVRTSINNKYLSSPIEMEVYGSTVTKYKSCIREVLVDTNPFNVLSPKDIIEKNYNYMGNKFQSKNEKKKGKVEDDFLNNIDNVYFRYYDLIDNNTFSKLRASWVIEIGDHVYVYDAENGLLIDEK
ncbi:hypothetical protein PV797_20480 [Clostridiaceae bacterium M8S5]|nr:hypothetical protein PV797_20480 [Clostridiaceae bacterium M8S5]